MSALKSAMLQQAKTVAHTILPWPTVRWCERIYFAKYGEPELCMVKYLCRPDRDSIDVGANTGPYLHWMTGRRVIAFEPIPWLAELLAKKFGERITVETVALSNTKGQTTLHIPVVNGKPITGLSTIIHNPSVKTNDITIKTRRLDDLYSGNVGFIKIDVEGHEYSVLLGAEQTIKRCRPRILIEAEERHAPGSTQLIQDFFRRLDYRGYFVLDRQLVPIERFDPTEMQRSEDIANYTLGMARGQFHYINNFLFLPGEETNTTLPQLEKAVFRRTK